MQRTIPRVYHVAQTRAIYKNASAYLEAIGAQNWTTDAPSEAEFLIELLGRGCYRSFAAGMNANVTKVREGNASYMKNILSSEHGSVLEHAYDTYIFLDVSRVFTHELVRHRLSNFAQESLRFVRLDALKAYWPTVFEQHPQKDQILAEFESSFVEDEQRQVRLTKILALDELKDFKSKKALTSAMRRMAPMGLATMIGYTTNHRNFRHVIELRTSRHAEEEIRGVWYQVYVQQKKYYPNIYSDAREEWVDDGWEVTFENSKI